MDCPAIDGFLKEASEVADYAEDKQVLDAALIAAAQAVDGRDDFASVLQHTWRKRRRTRPMLNKLALSDVIKKAA